MIAIPEKSSTWHGDMQTSCYTWTSNTPYKSICLFTLFWKILMSSLTDLLGYIISIKMTYNCIKNILCSSNNHYKQWMTSKYTSNIIRNRYVKLKIINEMCLPLLIWDFTRNLGTNCVCRCWNEIAIDAIDLHIFMNGLKKV